MRKGGFLLRLSVSLAALAGLLYALQGKLGEAFLRIRQGLEWEWLLLALGVHFVAMALISWRLQLIFHVQGVKVRFPQAFYLSFVSLFFTLFFPSAFGGDVAKGYFVYQYSGKKLGTLTGVILDRLIGFVTLVLIAVTTFLVSSQKLANPVVQYFLYSAVGFLVFGAFFFTSRGFAQKFQALSFLVPSSKWRENLSNFYHAVRQYGNHKNILVSCGLISVVAQFLFLGYSYLLARALGIGISLWSFFLLMPLVVFASMAPSLSGLGVREAGFVFFFKSLIPAEQAFALSLLYDFLFYGLALAAGLVFAFKGGLKREWTQGLGAFESLQEVRENG